MKKTVHSKESARLSSLLKDAREKAGYTQKQLADLLQRHQSFIAKYELGERRIDVIEFLAIAKVLKVDPIRIIRALI